MPDRIRLRLMIPVVVALLAWKASAPAVGGEPFEIRVVDAETGRAVPLVELRTAAHALHVTDNGGRVAFREPGLMDREVFFHVRSHGYRHEADGFGYEGRTIAIEPGGEAVIEVERENVAERLYRVTGYGLFRDSVLLGHAAPLARPVLNANVVGQDSVQATPYRDRVYWFWGDTHPPGHPLRANFRTSGATSPLPQDTELARDVAIDLDYFTGDEGFVRPMAPLPSDQGNLMWISGLLTTHDACGRERLVAHYDHRAGLGEGVGQGLLVFDDAAEQFEILKEIDVEEPWRRPIGQATRYEQDGEAYWLFVRPWPLVRVPDSFEAIQDRGQYQAFTCLAPGSRFAGGDSELERDADGQLVWDWKGDTDPVGQERERQLIEANRMTADEARFQLVDVDTGEAVHVHRATANWNDHLERWILIATQIGGRSYLGEVWFAHAESPTGPWTTARRIVTHEEYSFYNPAHHTFLDGDNGRFIHFEATYTNQFTGGTPPTPYYDYNQIMYRLDLDHPRLGLPLRR